MAQVPKNPDDNEFIDNEALRELTEKVVDTLRPLGLTVNPMDVQFAVNPEAGMMVMIPALVRPSASEKIKDDKAAREAFNKMMAEQNEAAIEEKAEKIRKGLQGNVEELLFGDGNVEDECLHERLHPSGFCLDCGDGMEDGLGDVLEDL